MAIGIVLVVQPNCHSNKVQQKPAKIKKIIILSNPIICRRQGCPWATTSPSLFSVAIKARAEHTGVFCRAVATKRSVAHLKGGLEEL